MSSLIERQAAIDAVNSLIDRFERILSDIRESTVDDSVCGMCEYDGAYMGQSGDWCNECPGFEKDNCFKLSDECRKRWFNSVELPSAQQWIPCKTALPKKENTRAIIQTNSGTVIIDGVYGGIDVYGHHVWRDGEGGLYWDDEIVAWMPFVIPEPWKGDKHEAE